MLIDSNVIDFFTSEMVLAKINAEADTALSKAYHVSGYPTVVLTNSDGSEIDRIIGYRPAEEFIQTLRDYKNGIGTLDDLLGRADTLSDRTLYFEIADKYKYRGGSEEANKWYQKVIDEGQPTDSLSGESRMAMADMYRRAKEYDQAVKAFSEIMKEFKGTPFAEEGEIYRAITYRKKGDTTVAIQAFEDFIKHYPESEDIEYASNQIKKLKGETEE